MHSFGLEELEAVAPFDFTWPEEIDTEAFASPPLSHAVWVPEGCIVWPGVRVQVLCWQHAGRAAEQGALAGISLRQDLTDGWFGRWWNGL